MHLCQNYVFYTLPKCSQYASLAFTIMDLNLVLTQVCLPDSFKTHLFFTAFILRGGGLFGVTLVKKFSQADSTSTKGTYPGYESKNWKKKNTFDPPYLDFKFFKSFFKCWNFCAGAKKNSS